MSSLHLLRTIHLFGAIMWIGGTAAIAVTAIALPSSARKEGASALRAAMLRIATPGMVLAFLGGLGILLPNFMTIYARAGWMHAKLLIVLVAAGLTGVISGFLRRAATGQRELPTAALRVMGTVVLLLGLAAVALVLLRPY